MGLVNVTLNVLYNELRTVHEELHALQRTLVPEVEIGAEERRELRAIFREMEQGREKNWRDVKR